jgi:phosphoglycerol transferase MdoB-like AlkP superfamily enzyme
LHPDYSLYINALLFITEQSFSVQYIMSMITLLTAQAADPYNTLKSLAVLALMIGVLAAVYYKSQRKPAKRANAPAIQVSAAAVNTPIPDEVVATIVMMLNNMQENVHDQDTPILTLREVSGNYSPWNSKIFGMRQAPPKK